MSGLTFSQNLAQVVQLAEARLDVAIPESNGYTSNLHAAMRHAVFAGGKRLRAFLAMETARLFDVEDTVSVTAAAAIECLHAYSLVHDDLPCMDDDDMRRGQPTVHVKWDEATAVLVGDALQTLAFELLVKLETHIGATACLRLIGRLADASGKDGMVAGQAIDMAAETAQTPMTFSDIGTLQAKKTGALIIWSAQAGGIMGGATEVQMSELSAYANAVGLAFQIRDDILDIEGDAADVGKRVGKDADAGKATFVTALGIENARLRAEDLVQEAINHISSFGSQADHLKALAQFAVSRQL
jgi:farnesyl diphosphate synthase